MSKRQPRIDIGVSKQLALIDTGLPEGSLDIGLGLKQLISRELQGFDRWAIAAQISKSTGVEISKETLDKRLSSDVSYQMYAIHVTAIAAIIGALTPFKYLLEPLGSDVLDPADRDLIELARIQEKIKQLDTERLRILQRRGLEVKS